MANKSWTFTLEQPSNSIGGAFNYASGNQTTHTLELQHNYWTAKRTIKLDGSPLSPNQIRRYGIYGSGSDDLILIDGHECVIHIKSNTISYKYDLLIDGVSVQTGETVEVPPQLYQMQPGASDKAPGWAWIFMVLCFVVGIGSTLAGFEFVILLNNKVRIENIRYLHYFATPIVLQAMLSIMTASKEPDLSEGSRIKRCAIIMGRTVLIVAGGISLAATMLH